MYISFNNIYRQRASPEELADPLFLLRTLHADPLLQRTYPAIVFLVSLAALIPSSTACVERLFSLMNSLCTSLRSTLSQNNLNSMIRIVSGGAERLSAIQIDKSMANFRDMKQRALEI